MIPQSLPQFSTVHRVITLSATAGRVRAEVSDNVHHFAVTLFHDGERVIGLEPVAIRVPWTTCPTAGAQLDVVLGASLADGPVMVDKSLQCTHWFDLTRLAIAHASRGGERCYDVIASPAGDAIDGRVLCDNVPLLSWRVVDRRVVSPGPFHGHITNGPALWPQADISYEEKEAALLLRRALLIYNGRGFTRDISSAAALSNMIGACHTFQPERAAIAFRPPDFVDYAAADIPVSTHKP